MHLNKLGEGGKKNKEIGQSGTTQNAMRQQTKMRKTHACRTDLDLLAGVDTVLTPPGARVRNLHLHQVLWTEGSGMGIVRTVGARAVAGGGRDGRASSWSTIFDQRKVVSKHAGWRRRRSVAEAVCQILSCKIATAADQSFVATTLFREFVTRRGNCEFICEAQKV